MFLRKGIRRISKPHSQTTLGSKSPLLIALKVLVRFMILACNDPLVLIGLASRVSTSLLSSSTVAQIKQPLVVTFLHPCQHHLKQKSLNYVVRAWSGIFDSGLLVMSGSCTNLRAVFSNLGLNVALVMHHNFQLLAPHVPCV